MASIQHRQRANGTVAYRVMFRERPGGSVVSETFDTAHQAQFFKELVERIGGAAARAKRGHAATSTAPTIATVLEDYIEQALDSTPGTAAACALALSPSGKVSRACTAVSLRGRPWRPAARPTPATPPRERASAPIRASARPFRAG